MGILDSLEAVKDFNREAPKSIGAALDILVSDLAPDPEQPRKLFDDALISTIATQFVDPDVGQIEAIFVRTNPAGKPPYLIVHGETRYRAALKAKLVTLRAIITQDSGFVRQVLSNEIRSDLPLLDKARAYQKLIDDHGFTQKSVGELLGKDPGHVSTHIALLDMPAQIEKAFNDGKATSVRVLTDLKNLVAAHKSKKALAAIEAFIEQSTSITRSQIAALAKSLASSKPKPKAKAAPMIDGKTFKVLAIEKQGDDDIISLKRSGEKEPRKYRLVPVE